MIRLAMQQSDQRKTSLDALEGMRKVSTLLAEYRKRGVGVCGRRRPHHQQQFQQTTEEERKEPTSYSSSTTFQGRPATHFTNKHTSSFGLLQKSKQPVLYPFATTAAPSKPGGVPFCSTSKAASLQHTPIMLDKSLLSMTELLSNVLCHSSGSEIVSLASSNKSLKWITSEVQTSRVFWRYMCRSRWRKPLYLNGLRGEDCNNWLKIYVKMDQRDSRIRQWKTKWEGRGKR
mmetsp:Transcript_5629/g.10074  ORF Transcript_5629/g.10074 Transcript_5629/m.10074 type:complete len:231 (-) Transcript_5629:778-1470(-)